MVTLHSMVWDGLGWVVRHQRHNRWSHSHSSIHKYTKYLVSAIKSSLALHHSTWLNVSWSTSLLGFCALLRMIEPFASPSLKENSTVVVPFASLLLKSGTLFLSLSDTAFPSLPSKQALKLTSSNSILTSNSFSAAQIQNSLSLFSLLFIPALLLFEPLPSN